MSGIPGIQGRRRFGAGWMLAVWLALTVAGGEELRGAPDREHPHDGRKRLDRFLVVPREGVDPDEFARWMAAQGWADQTRRTWSGGPRVMGVGAGEDVEQALRRCEQSGLVELVEPDYVIRPAAIPNDPRVVDGAAWHLENRGTGGGVEDADVDAAAAWDLVTDAGEVIVAVVDSGIRTTHEDLAANLWRNPNEIEGNGLDDDRNGIVDDVFGYNALTGGGDPTDRSGHGTHVAGIIGAAGNNGKGSSGIAWKVRLMALRFIDETQGGSTSDAIACMDYAVAQGARVINASWGSAGRSRSLERAIVRARNAGVIVVAAAGNDGVNLEVTPSYPASYTQDNLLTVTATSRGDGLYPEGNTGAVSVDLAAPGMEILSTWAGSDSDYLTATGTSMATPMVTGALALLIARHPDAEVATLRSALLGSVDPLPALAGKTVTGGRLNLAKALRALDSVYVVAPQVAVASVRTGVIEVTLTGTPGQRYALEVSGDGTAWAVSGEGVADGAGVVVFPESTVGSVARFFRARQAD